MSLYSIAKGKSDLDDIIFFVADQINKGVNDSWDQSSPNLRLDLIDINEMAGVKAFNSSDYSSASSYLGSAMSLLPDDHCECHYERSLRISFLLSKSAYSCGDVEKARSISQEKMKRCRCIEDKLSFHLLLGTIQQDRGEVSATYNTCREVLSQLGETVPQSMSPKQTSEMIRSTLSMVKGISDSHLLAMRECDEKTRNCLKFYTLMTSVAHNAKPEMFPFICCRMIQLTMSGQICTYSISGTCWCVIDNFVTNQSSFVSLFLYCFTAHRTNRICCHDMQ